MMCPPSSFWRFWQDATLSTSSPCCSSRSGSLDWRPGSSFSTPFSFRHFLLQTPSPSHPKPSLPPQRHLHDGLRLHDSCPCCRKVQNTLCSIIHNPQLLLRYIPNMKSSDSGTWQFIGLWTTAGWQPMQVLISGGNSPFL